MITMKNLLWIVLVCFCVSTQAQNQKAVKVDPNAKTEVNKAKQGPIEFTLRNGSMKKIPLWIPGVMNPNLSPMSNSGVGLKIGQKVYFKYKGKKELLLVVQESYHSRVFEVSKLIKDRSLQLDKEKRNKRSQGKTEDSAQDETIEAASDKKSKKKKGKKK